MKRERITVLYAEEAVSFGDPIVAIGYLAAALDKTQFRPVVTGEMDPTI